jgi:hypothetical protein
LRLVECSFPSQLTGDDGADGRGLGVRPLPAAVASIET